LAQALGLSHMPAEITIRGARQHNLRDLDLDLPRDALVVVTGVSGSGKSSLAFDTLFREGQRRFLGSFSAHARQAMGRLSRPRIGSLGGISPPVALRQARALRNPRSTVGTVSGLLDGLRLLLARMGETPPGFQGELPLRASLFSFNTAQGACPDCGGLGSCVRADPQLLVADPALSLRAGALVPTTPSGYVVYSQVTMDVLDQVCQAHGFSVDIPWKDLSEEQRWVVLYGSDRIQVPFGKHPLSSRMRWSGITARPRKLGTYKGLVPVIEGILARGPNRNAMRFARSMSCEACAGSRFGPQARAVRLRGRGVAELCALSLSDLGAFLQRLESSAGRPALVGPIASAALKRIAVLTGLGLEHLALERPAAELSSGEARRLLLGRCLGGGLQGMLYVLDEPSVGLHAQEIAGLTELLRALRDDGNSVVVVEHDAQIIAAADWLTDLGPGGGAEGGALLFNGPPAAAGPPAAQSALQIGPACRPIQAAWGELTIRGARARNLAGLDVSFALGALNLVAGVSGAGKTSLVGLTLGRAMRARLHGGRDIPGEHDALEGWEPIRKLIEVDQAPIGRTPRSNPATYTKLWDVVRGLFAQLPEARSRGWGRGRFSFNVKGGRCAACEGAGVQLVGMRFLGELAMPCERCHGRRFNQETLQLRYRGHDVSQLLELTVSQAAELLADQPRARRMLAALEDVGLGYIRLGQPATTLSGGEAQRVKLAAELGRAGRGHTLYLLDEPTAGLHDRDVGALLRVLRRLADEGNTVVAVEHHLDFLAAADRVVELGPGGGQRGGELVCCGSPQELMEAATPTGRAWRAAQRDAAARRAEALREQRSAAPSAPGSLRLEGVRTHNLKAIDVEIPRQRLSVVTGPSGSGKSSLVYDTLHAEARLRYAERLSAYARGRLRRMKRPLLERASGLTPTVAVGQEVGGRNPRSTVGTASEVLDLLRLLYARAAEQRCPDCGQILDAVRCGGCGTELQWPPRASLFSFNQATGACPACRGLGWSPVCDPQRLVSHPQRSLLAGAMDGSATGRFYGERDGQYLAILGVAGQALGLDFSRPWQELDAQARQVAMRGSAERSFLVSWRYKRGRRRGVHRFEGRWLGFATLVEQEYARKHADRRGAAMEALMVRAPCSPCGGARLGPQARAARFAGLGLARICDLSVERLAAFLRDLRPGEEAGQLSARSWRLSAGLRSELAQRLEDLRQLGLGYLQLARATDSLSAGEARRLKLARQLRAGLCDVTYVLDEPTLGLHARDTAQLLRALRRLTDAGNTVVVVEHDDEVIRAADHVLELGPGAGTRGGELLAAGSPEQLAEQERSLTGRYLRAGGLPLPTTRRPPQEGVRIHGASANNLAQLDLHLPSGVLLAVTGVSGSGKSSLVFEVLAASARAGAARGCRRIEGLQRFSKLSEIDGRPIGRSPRSTPASFTGLFDGIRACFARSPAARERGFGKAHFSFLDPRARCEACQGMGAVKTEMGFLADAWLPCERCGGQRYQPEILSVRLAGRNIAQVLEMNAGRAMDFFAEEPGIAPQLRLLCDVGLGYLRLGQPADSLSRGEAQRLKLARQLAAGGKGARNLYLLDEPTTGLHTSDVELLIVLLGGLVERGHSVVLVEHNLDVIASADQVLDLGPGAGPAGGRIVGQGTPEQLAESPFSATGAALRSRLGRA